MAETYPNAPPTLIVEGLVFPVMFSADGIRSGLQYQPQDDDLFIVTYPKCGTTWVTHIISLILNQGQPMHPKDFFLFGPFLEMTGANAAETMPRPGAIRTHFPFRLIPWSEKAKYINIARNPKDACVSYFHHMKSLPVHNFNGNFDEFFEMFISGNIDYGDYFDHLLGWYEHRNDPNVLFLTYESMKEDPKGAILKMASFIDDKLYGEPLRSDPEKLSNVLNYSSFDYMKGVVNKSMDDMFGMSKEEILKSDLPNEMKKAIAASKDSAKGIEKPTPINFIRKGIIGDWKNYFSEEQSKRMDEKFSKRTEGTEILNFWKEYI